MVLAGAHTRSLARSPTSQPSTMGPAEEFHTTRLLQFLPARPPTPPRETVNHEFDALPRQLTAHLRSLQTPPGVLSPSASSKDSTARRKRVGFSSQAQYQDPPIYVDQTSRKQQPTPVSLPPSTSRPVKGILKPAVTSNRLEPTRGRDLEIEKPVLLKFAEMLESTLQQLAGADRESKIDAYIMLFRGLKASSNLPDRIALQQKLDVFLQFIQRDLSARASNGNVDLILATSAVKLLHTFLRHQGIASSIPNEFAIFLVDHCVRSFQDEQAPKEVVRHLMNAMYLQNFGFEVMTSERVGRLVNALHNLENHMSGKSIIQSRILVYEKLVKQCPQHMAIHSDWLQDLFTDMLSSAADIRSAAIRLGLHAAFCLNKDKRVVSRALDLLNLSLEDQRYVEHICERLSSMLESTDDCVFVPRVWSVITLFIPNPDSWDYFKPWTTILQRSFNLANYQVKKEANLAWSRYTYRLFLDGRLGHKKTIRIIRDPLLIQVKRKALRDSVLGSIRNFYYYACRPGMNLKMLDDIWDLGVAPLMQQLINHEEEGSTNITQAAALLTGLIDCSNRRIWNQDRIADPALIKDSELPAIESKWIRANASRVFKLVGPILGKGFAELSVPASQYQRLWQALIGTAASASAKDVKLHDDTAKFVASAFTFLLGAWKNGPTSKIDGKPYSSSQFLNSTKEFILTLVQGLGLLPNPFTDKQFVRSKEDKFLLYTSSTSHRPGKHHPVKRIPLHHLFILLSQLPPGLRDDDTLAIFFENVFSPFFDEKRESTHADLSQELLRLLPVDIYCPYGPWALCATRISASLEQSQRNYSSSGSTNGGNLGPEYRDIVKVLERGLRSTPNLPWQRWAQLFQALLYRVKHETGDAGVAIGLVEPLAAVLNDLSAKVATAIEAKVLCATTELLAASAQPRDKLAVDAARRRLWGISTAGARQASFDPYDNLYKLVNHVLEKLYTDVVSCDSELTTQFLTELKGFYDRGNPQLALRALIGIQESIICWLEDKDHRITRTAFSRVVDAVSTKHSLRITDNSNARQMESLWQTLCKILVNASAETLQLSTVEPLLCAAFRSTHRNIVNFAAETWNQIYEHVNQIEYPETLKNVLASLGSSVDITRPGLELRDDGDSNVRLDFTESQTDAMRLPFESPTRFHPSPLPRPSATSRSATSNSAKAIESQPEGTTPLTRKKSKVRTAKIKLRHEDSQMQFAAIESSPALLGQESQFLTDRQKEIRERQRETAAMFPAVRSSPIEKTKKALSTSSQQPSAPLGPHRASTPEHDGGGFDDCLTSTPTPRRGQPVSLPEQDQEMTDPPSSPPEPRSFRLLVELKSQTSKPNVMDDWHFSSSPISGSPNPTHQTNVVPQSMDLDDVDEELQLDHENGMAQAAGNPEAGQQEAVPSQLVIEDTTIHEQFEETSLPATTDGASQYLHTTPPGRKLQASAAQVTPRSDSDEFVDARASPMPPTPNQTVTVEGTLSTERCTSPRHNTRSQSFDISVSFENGLRNVGTGKIEIPLRSSQSTSPRKQEYASYKDILPQSPEQPELHLSQSASQPAEDTGAMDVIEVAGDGVKKPRRGRPRKGRSGSAVESLSLIAQPSQGSQILVPSTPIEQLVAVEAHGNFDNVSPGSGMWWRKRKRSVSSSVYSSGGSKKARHEDFLAVESIQEEVPDSQTAAGAVHDRTLQMQTMEDLYSNDVSFASNIDSSPIEHIMASQDLPSAADEEPVEDLHSQPEVKPVPQVDVPKAHTDYMQDIDNFTDDEEAVHSQLAREEEESVSRAASPIRHTPEPVEPVQEIAQDEQFGGVTAPAPQQDVTAVEGEQQLVHGPETTNTFDGLMNMFRNGLDMLRATNLTREQVYKVEDLMFDMRRDLLEAERRGRE